MFFMFHATQAILILKEIAPKSHNGIKQKFVNASIFFNTMLQTLNQMLPYTGKKNRFSCGKYFKSL